MTLSFSQRRIRYIYYLDLGHRCLHACISSVQLSIFLQFPEVLASRVVLHISCHVNVSLPFVR